MLFALSSHVLVGTVRVSKLLGKGLSTDTMDKWFENEGDANACCISTEDVEFTVLEKHSALFIPFGVFAFWTYAPQGGQVDKPDKAPKGRVLVQWVLPSQIDPPPLEQDFGEVQQNVNKVMAQYGKTKPWSDVCQFLKEWFDKQQGAKAVVTGTASPMEESPGADDGLLS